MNVTKSDLVSRVCSDTGLNGTQATKAVYALFDNIEKSLQAGNTVSIHGFGKFEPVTRAARPGRNPRTGETVTIPATKAVKFSVAKQLKDAVND